MWENRASAPAESKLFDDLVLTGQFYDGVFDNMGVFEKSDEVVADLPRLMRHP